MTSLPPNHHPDHHHHQAFVGQRRPYNDDHPNEIQVQPQLPQPGTTTAESLFHRRHAHPHAAAAAHTTTSSSLLGKSTVKIPMQQQQQQSQTSSRRTPSGTSRRFVHKSSSSSSSSSLVSPSNPQGDDEGNHHYPTVIENVEEDDEDEDDDEEDEEEYIDYALEARKHGIQYPITEVPPIPLTFLLGCQHALTLLGGLVLIPLTIVPLMGGTPFQAAEMIGTIYFVMGLNTLIQSTLGNRLPIFQVTSFSYLPPTISIINNTQLQAIEDDSERFKQTIQVISGSIMVAGFVQMALGYSGAVVPMLKYISPVTIASVTIAIGLGYYDVGFSKVATCFPMGLTMMLLAVICSQFFKPASLPTHPEHDDDDVDDDDEEILQDHHHHHHHVFPHSVHEGPSSQPPMVHQHHTDHSTTSSSGNVGRHSHMAPVGGRSTPTTGGDATSGGTSNGGCMGGIRFFLSLLPILMAMTFTGSLSAILTAYNVWDEGSACRTDGARDLIEHMPFLRIPYPGQWHGFRFELYGIVPMMGAVMASMIESVGHYYTCARVSGAPPPTPGIISRGLAAEGIGVMMAGLYGTGSGVTSSSGNIGVIALTGVGSRAVVQMAALIMIVAVGMMGKVSAALAALPSAIVGGMFCVVLAVLVAVGLSNLQYVSLRNDRNLFIIGFAVFNCLSIAGPGGYFSTLEENPFGDTAAGRIALALLSSPMVIAVLVSFTLDNTIPGTDEERGLKAWTKARDADIHNDPQYVQSYSLPSFWARLFQNCGYLEFFHRGTMPIPPVNGQWAGSRGDMSDLFVPPPPSSSFSSTRTNRKTYRSSSGSQYHAVEMDADVQDLRDERGYSA